MRYAATPQVSSLTGLSNETLREWTVKRSLIPADVPAKKRGSPAKFSWHTVLVLRVASVLRNTFHLELQAHATSLTELRNALRDWSFVALWNRALILQDNGWEIIDDAARIPTGDALVIHLNPHLEILSTGFALPDPESDAGQLDLLRALPVYEKGTAAHEPRKRGVVETARASSK
jgi:hypothetical protein